MRRKHFDAVKGYEEAIRGSEDVVLWLKIAANSKYIFMKMYLSNTGNIRFDSRIAKESGLMNEWDIGFYKVGK